MDDLYRDYILDHYRHPRHFGDMADATFEAEGVNPVCGDQLKVQVRVDAGERVSEVKFSGSGCAISQAAMSILSDEIVGRSLDEVVAMTKDDIVELIGIDLTPARLKCALLGLVVIKMGMHEHFGTELPAGYAGVDEIAWEGKQ